MFATQMNQEYDEVRQLPDKCLHQSCEEVTRFDDQLFRLAQRMTRVLRSKEGMGLAAPQLGVMQRLIVVDCTGINGRDAASDNRALIIANPQVIQSRGSELGVEGCLSIPGQSYLVTRATSIVVSGRGLTGAPVRVAATGNVARCLQHEIDHLEGLTIDQVGKPA